MRTPLACSTAACTVAALLSTTAAGAICPSRAYWPTSGWADRTMEVGLSHAAQIAELEQYTFTLVGADADRVGVRTDGVVIIQQGSLVYERYARGYAATTPHYSWSVTKTVTNAFVGLALGSGLLGLADSICDHLPFDATPHCDITVQNLLEFSSGLTWAESYENGSNQMSSVLAMLYGVGSHDMAAFVAGQPSRDRPGTTYEYSSGDATLLMSVADHALRPAFGPDYDQKLLFDVLGLDSATFERDAAGTPVGSSYFYATPRDLAKFGFLYLNDGCWMSGRVLPEGWIEQSTAVSLPFRLKPLFTDPGDVQGRQIWLNRPVPEQGVPVPWPDVPQDAYAARGHWGQSITVIPSLDVIIVRVADDRDGTLDFNRFLKLAIAVTR